MASFKLNEGDILVEATPDLLKAPNATIISTASRTMSSILSQNTEEAQWALAQDLTALGALYGAPASRKQMNGFGNTGKLKSMFKVKTFLSSMMTKMPNAKNQEAYQILAANVPQEHNEDPVVECTNDADTTCEPPPANYVRKLRKQEYGPPNCVSRQSAANGP
eukprot:gene15470-18316_t